MMGSLGPSLWQLALLLVGLLIVLGLTAWDLWHRRYHKGMKKAPDRMPPRRPIRRTWELRGELVYTGVAMAMTGASFVLLVIATARLLSL